MTGRASRVRLLTPSFLVLATALACGSSSGGEDGDPGGGSGSGGTGQNVAGSIPDPGTGANPGTGGASGPNPTGGVGNTPGTGGVATAGSFGVAGAFVIGGAAGFGATGGAGPFGGQGMGGSIVYPPGSCPPQPPPNGTSCAAYVADPGHHCYYDAPACRVVSTCTAGKKWSSGCEAPGEAGAPNHVGGAGGAEN